MACSRYPPPCGQERSWYIAPRHLTVRTAHWFASGTPHDNHQRATSLYDNTDETPAPVDKPNGNPARVPRTSNAIPYFHILYTFACVENKSHTREKKSLKNQNLKKHKDD